jgi:hypothetical protein
LNPERWEIYVTYFGGLILNNIEENFDRNEHNSPDDLPIISFSTIFVYDKWVQLISLWIQQQKENLDQ